MTRLQRQALSYTQDEDKFIIENWGKVGPKAFSELLGRSQRAVLQRARILRKTHAVKRIRSDLSYQPNLNRDFFKKPNILNSYWAGFIAADGYLDSKRDRLAFHLSVADDKHLLRFMDNIGYSGNLYYGTRGDVELKIPKASAWISDLCSTFNIQSTNKTWGLEPPINLSNECSLAYIIGYIDGDGSISSSKIRYNTISFGMREQLRPCLSILGTLPLLEWVRSIFIKLRPNTFKNTIGQTKDLIWTYMLFYKYAVGIVSRLKEVEVPKLDRKWSPEHLKVHGFLEIL